MRELKTLILADITDQMQRDWQALQDGEGSGALCLDNVDAALEFCENRLILETDPDALRTDALLPLSEMDILRSLSELEITRLEPYIETMSYAAGDIIIREGDPADRLYLLASGNATVDVVLDDGKRRTRLAAFRPGVSFGEFALFDRGRRVANVVAETEVICYVLNFQMLEQLETTEPDLYHRVLFRAWQAPD